MNRVDFHVHSSCSDGDTAPDLLVQQAHERGITHMALTDHDTVSGLLIAREKARACGMRFLCGMEITTEHPQTQHLLALGIAPEHPAIQEACTAFVERRQQRSKRIAEILWAQGFVFSLDEVYALAKDSVGRPHFAEVLQSHGYVPDVETAFRCYLNTPEIQQANGKCPEIAEAIRWVHMAGGLAVLAHPASLKLKEAAFAAYLDMLCEMGLDGIEAYYFGYSSEHMEQYRTMAQERGLFVTAGTDYHGISVKPQVPQMGMEVPDWVLQQDPLISHLI